jgi:uncharacterized protein YdhG (YjbR/CyaY superfamily)
MAATSVDEYLAEAPEPHRSTLVRLRANLRELLPGAEEGMSYGVPAIKVGGQAVAGYAYFKNHCSYFPHSGSILSQIPDELSDYEWSQGTLRFSPDRPLPTELVRRLVDLRLEQLGS